MQIISNKKWNQLQSQLKAMQTANIATQFNNLVTQIFPHWQVFKEVAAYATLDDVYSVVSRLATTAAMIPLCGDDENGEDIKPNDPLNKFLSTLDFEQKEKMYTFLYLSGEVFGYKEKLEFGPNAGLSRLHFLHPGRMVVILSETFPIQIVGYTYYDSVRGVKFDIAKEDMVFMRFFNPSIDSLQEWRGLSPIKVLMQRLTRLQANLDVSVAQMQNGGLPGIVYEKTPGVEVGASGQRKENFAKFLNNPANKMAPYFSNGDLGYLAIGSTLADLDLANLADIDFKKICNAYSISDVLFNSDKGAKYDNTVSFEKAMYTNAVLPQVLRIVSALNKEVVPEIKTKGTIHCELEGIMVLQENMKEKAEAWAALPFIVPNEMRESMEQDLSDDENADKMYVKSGYTLLEDLSIDVQPIDNSANDYVKPVA